jgi:nucleotide-binding universal stress UspA family protein
VFDELIVCLDGSSVAEKMIPLAHGLTQATGGKLVFLRVVEDAAEISAEEEYLTVCARQYGAQLRFAVSADPAEAIRTELVREPRAIAALTTHGRAAWAEAIMGSVAFRVLRESKRPVLLFRPQGKTDEVSRRITSVAVTLDGNEFSEKIIPHAIRAVRSLSARLLLLQA